MKPWSDELSCESRSHGNMIGRKSAFCLARWAAICCAAVVTLPALANLVSPISVNLVAPGGITGDATPLSLTQSVDYSSPINPLGGGAIGGFMLPDEQIALSGDAILIRAAQGDNLGGTGYLGLGGAHARYEFSGLSITGRTLTGINVFAFDGYGTSGFSGVASGVGVSLIDSNADSALDRLIFNLDDLLFVDRGFGSSLNFGEFRIDILSTPNTQPPPPGIPEPGTLVLAVAALGALRLVSPRRDGGSAIQSGGADHV